MERIKIAVLDSIHGHAGSYLALEGHPKFDLVAVSVVPDYMNRATTKRHLKALKNVPIYTDAVKMLDEHPEIEACVIAGPNVRHYEQFKLCFERGKHVISMKVPTLDLEEYDEIVRLADEAGVVNMVELEMRFSGEICRMHDLIASGKVGKPRTLWAQNTSHNPYTSLPWHASPEQSYGKCVPMFPGSKVYRGGALTDHPHIFDAVRYVLDDDYDEVYAETAPNFRDVPVEDFVFVGGRMKSGTVISLDPSYSRSENLMPVQPGYERYPKRVEVNMSVFGDEGYILGDVYGTWVFYSGLPGYNYTAVRPGYRGSVQPICDCFYDCVRNGKKPPVDLKSHRRTIQVVNAVYESIYTGKPVKV